MDISLWVAVVVIAVGTYAMRLLPTLWMRKHLKKHSDKETMDVIPQWLSILGPLMIAAMFGVSMVPHTPDIYAWTATLFGCLVTLATWKYTRSLGLPVFLGVVSFGLISLLLELIASATS